MTDPMTLRPLPPAEVSLPICGSCGEVTYLDRSARAYLCDECGLRFDADTLEASYIDPDAQPCGEPCDDRWHRHANALDCRYTCYPCALPVDHVSPHWTGCTYVWSTDD